MSDTSTAETTSPTARFVGVAVSIYDHESYHELPFTVPVVKCVAEVLRQYDYQVDVFNNPEEGEARRSLRELEEACPSGGPLIVLWSGHGAPATAGGLHLIGRDTRPGSEPEVDAKYVSGVATRSGASQILLLFDTCSAGSGVVSATSVARQVLQELPPNAERIWVGVVASSLELQTARDGVFLQRLVELLEKGPSDPELRLRWSAHSRGIRGDDVIDALIKEWDISTQQLDAQMLGNAWVMLPNPRYDPDAPARVVEHLLLAARGTEPGDEASYFSGRIDPVNRLVDWMHTGQPGIFVVTGPAGCGKSSVAGRVVSLSNPSERNLLLAQGAIDHADPGEGSVQAHVYMRGSSVERLVQELDDQLVGAGVLTPHARGPRNRGELLGELERQGRVPVIVIDGLDEAGSEALPITQDVLNLLAGHACIIVATRELWLNEDHPSLIQALAPQQIIDLGDDANQRDGLSAVRMYVSKRLTVSTSGMMDAAAVAEAITRLAQDTDEGLFLLARVVTGQLRVEPVDTGQPNWENALSQSVEAAFDRDIEQILPLPRDDTGLPGAARELLTALAWSYGAGFPVDIWLVVANALSTVEYRRDDLFWLLSQAGRYIVESGETGQAVYRLSHQRLVEHVRPRLATVELDAAQQRAAPVAKALADHYQQLLATGLEPQAPTYLWQYMWRHCADAGPVGVDALRNLTRSNAIFSYDLALSLNNLGIRYSELGRRDEALLPTQEAMDIRRELSSSNPAFLNDLASSLNNLGVFYRELGRRDEALSPTQEAVGIYRELSSSNPAFLPDLASSLNNLGNSYSELGRRDEALLPTEEAVGIYRELSSSNSAFLPDLAMSLNNLGIRYRELGRRDEALSPTQEAVGIYRELSSSNPAFLNDLASSLTNLGNRYRELGRRDEMLSPTQEAVSIRRELSSSNPAFLPNLASSLNNLGNSYSELGRRAEALSPTQEAVGIYRELSSSNPAFLPNLAMSLSNLGNRYSELGRRAEALSPTQEAVSIRRELSSSNPAFLPDLAGSLSNLGVFYSELGRRDDALSPTEEAVGIYRELSSSNPAFLPDLASSLSNLGNRYSELGRQAEALSPTQEAVGIHRELSSSNPAFLPNLAMSLNNLGNSYSELGRRDDALSPTEEAVAIRRGLSSSNPAFLPDLAMSLNNLGISYSELGRRAEALSPTQEAVGIYRELSSSNPAFLNDLAGSLSNLGNRYRELGRRDEALSPTQEAVGIYRELSSSNPAFLPNLAMSLNNLGNSYSELGRRAEALSPTEEAVGIYRELSSSNPAFLPGLAMSLNNLGIHYRESGRDEDADQAWDDTLNHFANQPANFVELLSRRAHARPANELPGACADLYRCLSLNELPPRRIFEARRTCRELRQREPSDFDSAWRALTGELPEWLLIDPSLYQDLVEWVNTPNWRASYDYLNEHTDAFLTDAALPVFEEFDLAIPNDPMIRQYRELFDAARQQGIDASYHTLLLGETLQAWMDTETPDSSKAFLDEHEADLMSDEALTILTERAANGDSKAIVHQSILTLAHLGHADQAYEAATGTDRLQAELDLARQESDADRLKAYATIGLAVASADDIIAQSLFHLALGHALTGDADMAQESIAEAKSRAPDLTSEWLGFIRDALGHQPDHPDVFIAMSQTLLVPDP